MAFAGSSFDLWLDSGLSAPFSGTLTLTEQTSLVGEPQDTILYMGSVLDGRQLQAASNPGTANIVLTPVDTLVNWVAATSYIIGNKRQPVIGNGFVYKCTSAGTSGVSEPSWPVTPLGATVNDGTCVWTLLAAHHNKTEVKLALSSGGLAGASAGAALNVAATVLGGVSGAVPIHIRVSNAVTDVSNSTGNPEIGLNMNSTIETEAV